MSAASVPAPARPSEGGVSYRAIVAAQLRKNRVAMVALQLVKGLVIVAVVAPLLAFNVPLVWIEGGRFSLPVVEGLFDRFLFSGGVDVFFNLLLLALPVWMLAARLARAVHERRSGARARAGVALLLVVAVEVAAMLGGRAAVIAAVVGVALPGGALLAWARLSPARAPSRANVRLGLLGLFVVGFVAILGMSDTRPWVDWRAALEDPARAAGITSVFPPAPYHPANVGESQLRSTERVLARPSGTNWLGCDTQGRDVLTRILFGTRISLTIGLVAVGIYVLIGIILGGLAGYFGGWIDLTISRLIEIMICFPTLILIMTIIAVFDTRSIFLIMIAIGLVGWPGVARLVRGEFLRQRNLDYVTAARAQGLPERRILFRHVLPNCLGPVLVSATFGIAGAIIVESGLAFLGLGDKSAPSWGEMLTRGRESLAWHLILVPGTAIFFVVTVFNLLGEGLRDALDPKLRR